MEKIKVAIFEDDPQFREGLVWLLATEPRFELVGKFSDAERVVEKVAAVRPQVVLMDVLMPPGRDGIAAAGLIRERFPEIQVVMLTGLEDEEVIFRAIRAGANGYLLKSRAAVELFDALTTVVEGGSPMTPRVAARVLSFCREKLPAKTAAANPKPDFTTREMEVLRSLTQGNSYKMIAAEHHIALDTVRNHLRKIYEKLQVHSMSEAVAKALNERLV